MVTQEQLGKLQAETVAQVTAMVTDFQTRVGALVGDGSAIDGHMKLYMHEMTRRAEEVMHRANDVIAVLGSTTAEGADEVTQDAQAAGRVVDATAE